MKTISGRISEFAYIRTVNAAASQAPRADEFALSRWMSLLPSDEHRAVVSHVAETLGRLGCGGEIYTEQADIGSGMQDLGDPRVVIETRGGEPTHAVRQRKLGSSVLTTLERFSDATQQ